MQAKIPSHIHSYRGYTLGRFKGNLHKAQYRNIPHKEYKYTYMEISYGISDYPTHKFV